MKVKVKHYDRSKYDPASRMDWEIDVDGVRCMEVKQGWDGYGGPGEVDPMDEYAVLFLNHGDTRIYANSRVDIFRI